MTTKDIIYQLQCLKGHCEDWVDEDEPDNIWADDVAALDAAIDRLQGGQSKRTESALTIFGLTAILGFAAACAGIVVAVIGHTTAGSILLLASAGWWLEALIAGRDCR